jgi:hypothetical protein
VKFVVPAKAGTHRSVPETAEKWVLALAGTTAFLSLCMAETLLRMRFASRSAAFQIPIASIEAARHDPAS